MPASRAPTRSEIYTVFLLKKTTTAKKLLRLPYILPRMPDCAKALLIVHTESVSFTEWKRKRFSPAHPTNPGTVDDGHRPSDRILDGTPRRDRHRIDFLDTPPNDRKQKEIQYTINIDSIVTGQGRNGRSSAKAVFNCLHRIARRTTSSVPGHQETQECRMDDSERSKESKEEHEGSW